jgi:peptidoglycan/xylan/chitin deacetylase (PgdA/CDA1 family)
VYPRSPLRNLLLGNGLVVALTLTLVVASLLAALGLFLELTGARTTLVAAHQPALVASQMVSEPLGRSVTDEPEYAETDPSADPHADPSEMSAAAGSATLEPRTNDADELGPPVEGEVGDQQGAGADARPVAALGDAVSPGPSPAASPEAVAEARPEPESPSPLSPPAARVKPEPGPRGAPRASADLPIVMYHHVGLLPPNPDIYRRDLTVSPDLFERTLQQLADRGVETVTMADLFEHFAGGPALPKRSVILTFDDGYDDVYEYAFQKLRQRGMVGTFFVTTDFVERPGYLTWAQIQEMADAGMEIAAHSSNHADFTRISPAELRRQLVEPKAILEDHTGQKVRFMAYPAGKYNAAVMTATRAAGYEAAVTVIHGTRHVPAMAFELRRVRARGADTANEIVTRMTPPSWRQ